MAAPGQLPVPDLPARPAAAGGLPRALGTPGAPAVGRADVPITTLFERLAIDVFTECDVQGADRDLMPQRQNLHVLVPVPLKGTTSALGS